MVSGNRPSVVDEETASQVFADLYDFLHYALVHGGDGCPEDCDGNGTQQQHEDCDDLAQRALATVLADLNLCEQRDAPASARSSVTP